jgi:predicted ATPase
VSIRKIRIEGFRSLRDATWEPGKLNVVIGPNGSGKSNLLRALALLQKSATGTISEEVLRLGGIAALLWDGRANEIAWTVQSDPIDATKVPNGDSLSYELRLRQLGASSSYRVEREHLQDVRNSDGHRKLPPRSYIDRRPGQALTFDAGGVAGELPDASLSDEQTLLALVLVPSYAIWFGFKNILAGWSIYHDIHVDQQSTLRQAAITRLDRRVSTDGQNLVPVLHTLYTGNRDFKKLVDDAMRVAFSKDYEELVFPPAADQRVQLRIRWRSLKTEQSAADLSDGTIRFLLLLAILGNPTPGALIAIDEPEIGLHPGMLPIVAELAVEASERTQVILTTHSPQLLDAFTATPPTTTVAQCIDGETHLSVIDGEELRRWLAEYSLGALFRSGELEGMV